MGGREKSIAENSHENESTKLSLRNFCVRLKSGKGERFLRNVTRRLKTLLNIE